MGSICHVSRKSGPKATAAEEELMTKRRPGLWPKFDWKGSKAAKWKIIWKQLWRNDFFLVDMIFYLAKSKKQWCLVDLWVSFWFMRLWAFFFRSFWAISELDVLWIRSQTPGSKARLCSKEPWWSRGQRRGACNSIWFVHVDWWIPTQIYPQILLQRILLVQETTRSGFPSKDVSSWDPLRIKPALSGQSLMLFWGFRFLSHLKSI